MLKHAEKSRIPEPSVCVRIPFIDAPKTIFALFSAVFIDSYLAVK